jgi:hypothetical protein
MTTDEEKLLLIDLPFGINFIKFNQRVLCLLNTFCHHNFTQLHNDFITQREIEKDVEDSDRKKVNVFLYRPWRPIGLREVEVHTFSDIRLTGGGEVVSLTRRTPFTPQEDSWYSFLLENESTPGP